MDLFVYNQASELNLSTTVIENDIKKLKEVRLLKKIDGEKDIWK